MVVIKRMSQLLREPIIHHGWGDAGFRQNHREWQSSDHRMFQMAVNAGGLLTT